MPYFVVYNVDTTIYANVGDKERFKSVAAAKAAITRAMKNGWIHDRNDVAIAEEVEFHNNIEKQVERKNLMSGKKYMEPVNTPCFLSPSRESYWSM